jgi:replicative DNA helicase
MPTPSSARSIAEPAPPVRLRRAASAGRRVWEGACRGVDPLFAAAESMAEDSSLLTPAELFTTLMDRLDNRCDTGIATGIDDLDELLGGLRPGAVTVVFGKTGHGKTTLALSIVASALTHGVPALVCSPEFDDAELLRRFLGMGISKDPESITAADLTKHQADIESLPLVVLPGGRSYTVTDLLGEIRAAVYGFGVRLVLIDPLDWLVEFGARPENRLALIAQYLRALVVGIRDLPAHFIVVASPRKTQAGKELGTDDIAGSQLLGADAWNILSVRAGKSYDGAPTAPSWVTVLKARSTGTRGKEVELVFMKNGRRIVQPATGGKSRW